MKATWKLACLVLALAATPRCESDGGSPVEVPSPPGCTGPGCNVASVQVGPTDATVFEGLSIKFTATARDAGGQVVTGVTFQWEVSDPALAEIDASGRLRGKEAGIVQVRAIANGQTGSVSLEVVDADVASLELVAPSSILINESAILAVIARNEDGIVVPTPRLQWASSDDAIVRVAVGRTSVLTGRRRGSAVVTVSAREVGVSVTVNIRARVKIDRSTRQGYPDIAMASGEDLQLVALFVDVNGVTLDEAPTVSWASSNPSVVSVSASGRVSGLQTGMSTIIARNSDGDGTMEVFVTDVIAGLPARLRLVHAAVDQGPVTFIQSGGGSVTLGLGESIDVPTRSGTLDVEVHGLGPHATNLSTTLVRGGDHLEAIATSYGLVTMRISDTTVPADSGLVRLVQGSRFAMVVYLGATGGAVPQLINCYFDATNATDYIRLPAGEFDVTMSRKLLTSSLRRRITVEPGSAITYVIAGETPDVGQLLAFPDF